MQQYVDVLCREIEDKKCEEIVSTIYIGGGTPSLLPPELFTKIVESLRLNYDLTYLTEFTVEVNPDDIISDSGISKLKCYQECGVNRISMGIQSLCDSHLKWMGRRHSAAESIAAFKRLRDMGFNNISIDLIFGFKDLNNETFAQTLTDAISLGAEHISAYQLSIDSGSVLYERGEEDSLLEDEQCAAQYSMLQLKLKESGYIQYEISNFCKEGFHSKHNSSYWDRTKYIGIGASAHSFDGNRVRSWNVSNIREYINGAESEYEILSDEEIHFERIMLGLRTTRGVPCELLKKSKRASQLKHAHLLELVAENYRIPEDKLFICDSIITQLV